MTYRLPASEGGSMYGGKAYSWYKNALDSIEGVWMTPPPKVFEAKFGYRVYLMSSPDGEFSRRFVEFPNEAEAIMFILKWS